MPIFGNANLPIVVLHCDDQILEKKGQAFKRIEALLLAQGHRYLKVADPWMLVWALGLRLCQDPRCPPTAALPAASLKRLSRTLARAVAADRLIIILDEDFSTVVDESRPQGSEIAPELTERGIRFFRYTGCYEHTWNAAQCGCTVIYKEDRAEGDAQRVFAQVQQMANPR